MAGDSAGTGTCPTTAALGGLGSVHGGPPAPTMVQMGSPSFTLPGGLSPKRGVLGEEAETCLVIRACLITKLQLL